MRALIVSYRILGDEDDDDDHDDDHDDDDDASRSGVSSTRARAFISAWRLSLYYSAMRIAGRRRFNDPISVCDLAWPWKTGRMLRD